MDDTSPAVRDITSLRSIARAAEEEETLDRLLNFNLDLEVALDAVDDLAHDPLLLPRSGAHDGVLVRLGRIASGTS